MKTLYLECAMGASGDMLMGALVSLLDAPEKFIEEMNRQGLRDVQHGEFGADMQISLVNDGPVTIVIDTDEWKK